MNLGPHSCRDYPDAPPGEGRDYRNPDNCPDCGFFECECEEQELCIACDEPVGLCQCEEGLACAAEDNGINEALAPKRRAA